MLRLPEHDAEAVAWSRVVAERDKWRGGGTGAGSLIEALNGWKDAAGTLHKALFQRSWPGT